MLTMLGALAAVTLTIAGFLWHQGATLVLPFASVEVLALAVAVAAHGRHVGDAECIEWHDGRLHVEIVRGTRTEHHELGPGWVDVHASGRESLVRLSSRGHWVDVGRHLRPEHRPLLAKELRSVLREHSVGDRPKCHGTV